RQVDRELRALARLAVDENEAAGLLDDAIDRGEAEPGAAADFLGREEWLENPREIFLGDADAGIADLDQHILPRRHDLDAAPQRARDGGVGGPDRQHAAIRHRVARIDGEIDDDLFDLALIDLDQAEIAAMHDAQ